MNSALHFRPWAAALVVFGAVAALPVVQLLWGLVLSWVMPPDGVHLQELQGGRLISLSLITTAATMCALTLGWIHLRARHLTPSPSAAWRSYFGFTIPTVWSVVFCCLLFAVFGILSEGIIVHFGLDPSAFMATWVDDVPIWLLTLALVVAAPIYEEVLFRGFLWQILSDLFGKFARLHLLTSLILSLIFSLIHWQYSLIEMGLVFGLSLILCYARYRSQSLLTPIFLHIINNGLALWWLL